MGQPQHPDRGLRPNGTKYVLDKAVIRGTDVTAQSAGIDTTSGQRVVNLTLNGKATKAFAALTATQASKYTPNVSTNENDAVLDQTAIVLDGNVVSAPADHRGHPRRPGRDQRLEHPLPRPRPPSWPTS